MKLKEWKSNPLVTSQCADIAAMVLYYSQINNQIFINTLTFSIPSEWQLIYTFNISRLINANLHDCNKEIYSTWCCLIWW